MDVPSVSAQLFVRICGAVRALLQAQGFLPFGLVPDQVFVCSGLYSEVELPLQWFQTAAVLEVFHSLFGLVRSPLSTTVVQVASRQILLWAVVVHEPPNSTEHPRLAPMLMAWAVTEVIRYSFYAFNLLGKVRAPFCAQRYLRAALRIRDDVRAPTPLRSICLLRRIWCRR